jgi:hypothetical protein
VAANSPASATHSATDVPPVAAALSRAIAGKSSPMRVARPTAAPPAIDESAIQITLK